MPIIRTVIFSVVTWTVFSALVSTSGPAFAAGKEKVLWSFNYSDGNEPNGGLVFDSSGNLYGTTSLGSAINGGLVFELVRENNDKWTEKEPYAFCARSMCEDGAVPAGGLVFDDAGNLYGTTTYGGAYNEGVVFRLSPGSHGLWHERVLHNFGNGSDGARPGSTLIFDAARNLYGVTGFGGSQSCYLGCGTVFQLRQDKSGRWIEKILHEFTNNGKDGYYPASTLTLDAAGTLYGATSGGGPYPCPGTQDFCGTVFELTLGTNGKWRERTIHSFNGNDGFAPSKSPLVEIGGNLYGTTVFGGRMMTCSNGCGVVFELVRGTDGNWTEKVLRAFYHARGPDGVVFDAAGNLYGVSGLGGHFNTNSACLGLGCGGVYELSPGSGGKLVPSELHDFGGVGDGILPTGNLVFDEAGNLYGVTVGDPSSDCGPTEGCGAVFEITP